MSRRSWLLAIAVAMLGTVGAWAYFAATGAGSARATVGSIGAPVDVDVQQGDADVTVSWTAATLSSGGAVQGYRVTRSDGAAICGTPTLVTAPSCTDANVTGAGRSYTVTAVFGGFTAAATSAVFEILSAPSLTSAPSAVSADAMPSFAFSGGGGSGHECRLDGAPFGACSSPHGYTVGDGTHVFDVRAALGDSTGPASSYTWSVDTTAPVITASPNSPSADTAPVFGFTHAQESYALECRLDAGSFAPCTSPRSYTGLADGPHSFQLRAVSGDEAVTSVATHSWTIDATAPVTTIVLSPSTPGGADGWHTSAPSFTLSASDAGATTRFYEVGAGPAQTYSGPVTLPDGQHAITYWSTDEAGNAEVRRTTAPIKVDTTAPNSLSAYRADGSSADATGSFAARWTGTPAYATGRSGSGGDQAFSFGGSQTLTMDPQLGQFATRGFKIAFSVKSGAVPAGYTQSVLSARSACGNPGEGWFDIRHGAGSMTFEVGGGSYALVSRAANFNDGNWHDVVAQRTAAGLRLTIDGGTPAVVSSASSSILSQSPVGVSTSPCNSPADTRAVIGAIDDLTVTQDSNAAVSMPSAASAHLASNRIYFRGNTAGSFTLAAAFADAGSGPASATFPSLSTIGWSHGADLVTSGTAAAGTTAYSSSFSWTAFPATPPAYTITATDGAGHAVSRQVSFVNDSTAPTGGGLTVNGLSATVSGSSSQTTSTSIPINFRANYAETQSATASGLSSSTLTVQSSSLVNGVCDAPGSGGPFATATTIPGTAQPAGIVAGFCYQYALAAADNVGNGAILKTTVRVLHTQTITFTSSAPVAAAAGGPSYTPTATGGASGNPVTITMDASNSAASTRGAADSSGANSTMTPLAGTAGSAGPISGSGSASFTGSNRLNMATRPITTSLNWTLEAWINPSTLSQTGTVVVNGDDGVYPTGPGGFGFGVFAHNGGAGGCLVGLYGAIAWVNSPYCFPAANTWYHVAMTNSGTSAATFYVNGSAVGSVNAPTPHNPAAVATIGTLRLPNGGYMRDFQGKISNVAFYRSGLSAARIAAHYAAAASQSAYAGSVLADSPAAYFKLNDYSTCSLLGAAVIFAAPGTCRVNANQAGGGNYVAAPQAQQAFTVAKGSQTLTFTSTAPGSAQVGGPSYTVKASSSAEVGVALTIDSSSTSVCSISGSTVTFTAPGTCRINANQAGNPNFDAAPQAQQSFTVQP